ncbi:MAG: TIGR02206 family membrane protein [Lachnospiraceae bacterium]|nr:TIGR02206 family membrane protein [Lachnospiraceae bacterium]
MYFFTYETDLPEDVGFAHFGPIHLIWLAAIMLGIALLTGYFRKQGKMKQRGLSKILAWTMCGILIVEHIILFITGHQTIYQIPLHLCTLMPVVCVIFAYTQWDWAGQTIYSLGIVGAALALLFPDWNMYPQWNYMNLTGFSIHTGLILFGVWQLVGGYVRPRMKAMWKPVLFLIVVVPPIYLIDRWLGTNYFFLMEGAPGSPLQVMQEQLGALYIPTYAGLALAVITLEYLLWVRINRRSEAG